MDLFRRRWRAQVGSLVVADSSDPALSLDIEFKVKKTLGSGRAGTLDLTVYNLSQEHRRELAGLPRRTTFVSLDAGYEGPGGSSRIFTGDLRKAVIAKSGTDWTVKVTAGTGEHAQRTARVSRSFAAGTSLVDVVRHLAENMEVGIGNAVEAFQGVRFAAGSSSFGGGTMLHGRAFDELERICDATGMTFSVADDNTLQVIPLGGALQRTAILLSANTGMIESPEIVNRRTITVKALIQPGLVPGQQVVVDSGVVGGVWRITEAEVSGSTAGNDWHVGMTCHRPRAALLGAPGANTPGSPDQTPNIG